MPASLIEPKTPLPDLDLNPGLVLANYATRTGLNYATQGASREGLGRVYNRKRLPMRATPGNARNDRSIWSPLGYYAGNRRQDTCFQLQTIYLSISFHHLPCPGQSPSAVGRYQSRRYSDLPMPRITLGILSITTDRHARAINPGLRRKKCVGVLNDSYTTKYSHSYV